MDPAADGAYSSAAITVLCLSSSSACFYIPSSSSSLVKANLLNQLGGSGVSVWDTFFPSSGHGLETLCVLGLVLVFFFTAGGGNELLPVLFTLRTGYPGASPHSLSQGSRGVWSLPGHLLVVQPFRSF